MKLTYAPCGTCLCLRRGNVIWDLMTGGSVTCTGALMCASPAMLKLLKFFTQELQILAQANKCIGWNVAAWGRAPLQLPLLLQARRTPARRASFAPVLLQQQRFQCQLLSFWKLSHGFKAKVFRGERWKGREELLIGTFQKHWQHMCFPNLHHASAFFLVSDQMDSTILHNVALWQAGVLGGLMLSWFNLS